MCPDLSKVRSLRYIYTYTIYISIYIYQYQCLYNRSVFLRFYNWERTTYRYTCIYSFQLYTLAKTDSYILIYTAC